MPMWQGYPFNLLIGLRMSFDLFEVTAIAANNTGHLAGFVVNGAEHIALTPEVICDAIAGRDLPDGLDNLWLAILQDNDDTYGGNAVGTDCCDVWVRLEIALQQIALVGADLACKLGNRNTFVTGEAKLASISIVIFDKENAETSDAAMTGLPFPR